MPRLVNVHTGSLETMGKPNERIAPGSIGDFNDANPSVKQWIRVGWLRAEGELLASRAAALTNAPSIAEMLAVKAELAAAKTTIDNLLAREVAHTEERKRVEKAFGELAEKHADADVAAAKITSLQAEVDRLTVENGDLRKTLELATAPAGSDAAAAKKEAGTRAQRPA